MLRTVLIGSTLTAVLLTAFTALGRFRVPEPSPAAEPGYVGRQTCATCHAEQDALWQGSHHDLAMQEATEATVRGTFDSATLDIDNEVGTPATTLGTMPALNHRLEKP